MTLTGIRLYAAGTTALLGAAAIMATLHAPDDPLLGAARHAFYVHLPFALNTYLWCAVAFVAAVGYLATRDGRWDRWSAASIGGAAAASTFVLATGIVLARSAWGHWWLWTPKLTFSLALWTLLWGYVVIRGCTPAPTRRAVVGAVYAVVALLDAPLVFLSVNLLPDAHPASVELDVGARATLLVCGLSLTLLCAGLVIRMARGPGAKPPAEDYLPKGRGSPMSA
jgi:heme exporter protein C